jgi:hypothetical protein
VLDAYWADGLTPKSSRIPRSDAISMRATLRYSQAARCPRSRTARSVDARDDAHALEPERAMNRS